MQAKPHTHVDVLKTTAELSTSIKNISKQLGETTNQNEKRQESLKANLKNAVFQLAALTLAAVEEQVIAADSTGIMSGMSIFPNPLVDEYAKEWQKTIPDQRLANACQLSMISGQDGGKCNTATFEQENGSTVIFDKIKGTITFIWHSAVYAVKWCVTQLIKLKDWLVMTAKKVWAWFMSFFKSKQDDKSVIEAQANMKKAIEDASKMSDETMAPMQIAA